MGEIIKLDNYKSIIDNRKDQIGLRPIAVTWVDGKVIFKDDRKWSNAFFGVCHYTFKIFLLTPKDWEKALTIASIMVAPESNYCEKKYICLNFKCPLNAFDKKLLELEFSARSSTLGLPLDIGTKPIWFNIGTYGESWKDFAIKPDGGILRHKD